MKDLTERLKGLSRLLRRDEDEGRLEPGQAQEADDRMRELKEAISSGDIRAAEAALAGYAKVFIKC